MGSVGSDRKGISASAANVGRRMVHCEYCEASFDDEDAYLRHLKADHEGELGAIDRRRVEGITADEGGLPTGPVAIGVILLVSIAVVGYVVLTAGGDATASDEPVPDPDVHYHGTLTATIDGEELDFSEERFLENDGAFHFHPGYYEEYGEHIWHVHARGVTLQYALETLGIEVDDDGTVLTYDGERYDDVDADTDVRIEVNGESVAPGEYVLEGVGPENRAADGEGDDVRIVVTTE